MYAGPPTESSSPERDSSSLTVTGSMALVRSDRWFMTLKILRCWSR